MAMLVAGFIGLLFRHLVNRLTKVIAMIDALGLGVYAVVGVEKSIGAGLSLPAAVLAGVIRRGGGLLRDLLVRDEPMPIKPGRFYALAALGGCLLFVFLTVTLACRPRRTLSLPSLSPLSCAFWRLRSTGGWSRCIVRRHGRRSNISRCGEQIDMGLFSIWRTFS
jgi:uncharacterized membrane protein YeiH